MWAKGVWAFFYWRATLLKILRIFPVPPVFFDVRKSASPRDKIFFFFAHDAWRFMGYHLKTERWLCGAGRTAEVWRGLCPKTDKRRHFKLGVVCMYVHIYVQTRLSVNLTVINTDGVSGSTFTRKVAWWVSKVVEVWRGRHLWSQLFTSPKRTVFSATYHGRGEGLGRYREIF